MTILDQVRRDQRFGFADGLINGPADAAWFLEQMKVTFFHLESAVPIDISNICQWIESEWVVTEKDGKRYLGERFWDDDLKMSFPVSWFEYKTGHYNAATLVIREEEELFYWLHLLRVNGEVALAKFIKEKEGKFDAWTHDQSEDGIYTVMSTVFIAQTFMHCKNVVVTEKTTHPKHAKAFRQKNGIRPAKFRQVVIEPMRRVIQQEGGVSKIGVEKALHIVRGHFADYTEDKPLFGHYVGKVFRQMHTRGNADLGVKQPDYKVKMSA